MNCSLILFTQKSKTSAKIPDKSVQISVGNKILGDIVRRSLFTIIAYFS